MKKAAKTKKKTKIKVHLKSRQQFNSLFRK